jgi:diguanylate cyclase (GGDEF)-like protein/PAS domain S-box-containing protein
VRERRTPRGDVLQIYNEITELMRREAALRESEERFRGFAETAADWLFELDERLCFTFVSQRFEILTGVSVDSLLGRPFESVVCAMARASEPVTRLLASLRAAEDIDDVEFEGASDGAALIHCVSARPLVKDGVLEGYRGSGRDVTQARRLSMQLAYQATHDELTGLVNRREFERRLGRVLASANESGEHHALCYLDLDQFKIVNDTCGHAAGDELLRQLGRMLKSQVRSRDTLARLGGDEFALLLEHCSLAQAEIVANGFRAAIEGHEFAWQGKGFRVAASVGLVPIDGTHVCASDALRAADSACYLAKDSGRNRVHIYASNDTQIARREGEMNWVARINKALTEDRFRLHAQPIVAADAACRGAPRFELLVRMLGDDGTLTAPGAFLPAAERYGLASRIDRWVISHALTFLTCSHHRLPGGSSVNINLSGQSLSDEDFFEYVVTELARHGLPEGQLCFEVTETAAISDLAGARKFMDMVRGHGCHFALDDFGTGLSSFAYLRDLPVDFVKIDGAFIRDIEHDPVAYSMVRSINDIGHVLGKRTIAEYVTSEAAARLLHEMGVDFLQGFGVGHPVPVETLRDTVLSPARGAVG